MMQRAWDKILALLVYHLYRHSASCSSQSRKCNNIRNSFLHLQAPKLELVCECRTCFSSSLNYTSSSTNSVTDSNCDSLYCIIMESCIHGLGVSAEARVRECVLYFQSMWLSRPNILQGEVGRLALQFYTHDTQVFMSSLIRAFLIQPGITWQSAFNYLARPLQKHFFIKGTSQDLLCEVWGKWLKLLNYSCSEKGWGFLLQLSDSSAGVKSLAFCSVNSAKHFQLLNLEVAVEANHWLLPDKCLQSVETRQGEIHHHVFWG